MPQVDLGIIVTMFNNAASGLRGLSDDVKKVGDNAQATHNRLKAIQVVIGGILLEKSIQFTREFLKAAAATQSLDLRLAHFAGGIGPAQAIWSKLNAEFGATPFTMDAITTSWIKLQTAIGNNDKTTKVLEAVVNGVAAMGGSDTNIEETAKALERMAARGTVSAREYQALLTDTGVTLADLAQAAGRTVGSFERDIRNGLMPASKFLDDFVAASATKFGNYALGLKFTVGGAMNSLTNIMSAALSNIGSKTDVNERIVLAFNNIGDAVQKFAASITQADIDKFFNTLASFEPVVRDVANLILTVGEGVITLGTIVAHFLGLLPPEVTEYGIIGYLIGGKKMALIFGLIGAADAAISKMLGEPTLLEYLKRISSGAKVGGLDTSIFAGDTAKIKKALEDLANRSVGPKSPQGPGSQEEDALKAQAAYANDLGRALKEANDKLTTMNLTAKGDQLGVELQAVVNETDRWKDGLTNILDKNHQLKIPLDENHGIMKAIKDLVAQGGPIDQGMAAQQARLKEINNLTHIQFELEQQTLRAQIERNSLEIARTANGDRQFNVLSGTGGGQLVLDVDKQRFALSQQIEDAQARIFANNLEMLKAEGDPQRVAQLQASNEAYKQLQLTAADAMNSLTAAGELDKQMWKQVGSVLDNDVSNGLAGLVTHTMSLRDVTLSVFNDITKAAADYLVKLAEVALQEEFLGKSGGGTGGAGGGGFIATLASIGSSLFGAANGAAFSGHVKAFANGDILTGPTLFGLAGEAGDEAIMPLTRIGGKLGVRSQGAGGGDTHIHLSAIDTQSGVEFLFKHADDLVGVLGNRHLLNRGVRT